MPASNERYDPNTGYRDAAGNPIYAIAIRSKLLPTAISVTSTRVKLPTTTLSQRLTCLVFNNGSETLYIGDITVTTANGMPINPNSSLSFAVEDGVDIYGIVATGPLNARVLETS